MVALSLIVLLASLNHECHSVKSASFKDLNSGTLYNSSATVKDLKSGGLNCHYRNDSGHDRFIQCVPGATCFTVVDVLYHATHSSSSIRIQGCWSEQSVKQVQDLTQCNVTKCIAIDVSSDSDHVNQTKPKPFFCCCSRGLCNSKMHFPVNHPLYPTRNAGNQKQAQSNNNGIAILAGIAGSVLFVSILAIGFCHYKKKQMAARHNRKTQTVQNMSSSEPPFSAPYSYSQPSEACPLVPSVDISQLQIKQQLYKSRNATIQLHELHGQIVAVKIFPSKSSLRWHNEKEIYQLIGPHPNVTQMITHGLMQQCNSFEGYIIMEYHPRGTLQNYLNNVTLSWLQMIKMTYSLANALAYVHGESKETISRPYSRGSVAHRNLSNRNVLVKSDGSCALADFGHALCIMGDCPIAESQYIQLATNDEHSRMYMAPELFTHSLAQSDEWGTSLKQVDCYALGLLFWEISVRCHDMVMPGHEVPDSRLPFEVELGCYPPMNTLREFVLDKNARPLFPNEWITNDFTVTYLKTIICALWDSEEGARLTASCAMNRIAQIKNITITEQSAILDCNLALDYNNENFVIDGEAVSLLNQQVVSSSSCNEMHQMSNIRNSVADSSSGVSSCSSHKVQVLKAPAASINDEIDKLPEIVAPSPKHECPASECVHQENPPSLCQQHEELTVPQRQVAASFAIFNLECPVKVPLMTSNDASSQCMI